VLHDNDIAVATDSASIDDAAGRSSMNRSADRSGDINPVVHHAVAHPETGRHHAAIDRPLKLWTGTSADVAHGRCILAAVRGRGLGCAAASRDV